MNDTPAKPSGSALTALLGNAWLDIAILFVFWLLFYIPIWIGTRHVGWDMDGYNFPLDRFIYSALQSVHHLPTYDWYQYNGVDFAGNIQSAAFYPPKLVLMGLLLFTWQQLTFPVYQFFALLHVLAFSLSTYFIARQIGLQRFWSVVTALCLVYTGVIQAQIQHFWFTATLPWLPLIGYGAYAAFVRRRRNWFYVYLVCSVCSFLIGYPLQYLTIQLETFALVLTLELAHAGAPNMRKAAQSAIEFAATQVAVLAMGAVAVLPFVALSTNSVAVAADGPIPMLAAVTFLIPNAFGHLSGDFKFPFDPTLSYFFVGLIAEAAVIAAVIARGKLRTNRPFWIALAFTIVNFGILFIGSPTAIFKMISPALNVVRSQSAGMPLGVSITILAIIVMRAADDLSSGRARLTVRAMAVLACLSLFVNVPAFFSTPSGPADGVEAFAEGFLHATIPSKNYILAIDQATVSGPADNWPRVVEARVLGGEDPLAQRPYLESLAIAKIHNASRKTFFSDDVDLNWLQENGVGFVESEDPKLKALAADQKLQQVQDSPYAPIYALPHPIGLASASCAKSISVDLMVDQLALNYADASSNCKIRLTTNYNPNFSASNGANITPMSDGLGMMIDAVGSGSQSITVSYHNPYLPIARGISISALVLLAIALWRFPILRLTKPASRATSKVLA